MLCVGFIYLCFFFGLNDMIFGSSDLGNRNLASSATKKCTKFIKKWEKSLSLTIIEIGLHTDRCEIPQSTIHSLIFFINWYSLSLIG